MFCQNFNYDNDDWYILTQPGVINSIAEDNYNVYFVAENGIYTYNKMTEDIKYDYAFSIQSNFNKIRYMMYDEFRDYYWIVHSSGVSFKSSVSSIWRDMSFSNSGIFNVYQIDDLGYSPEYIWIRSMDALYPFDPFTAQFIKLEEASREVDMINWGHSKHGVSGEDINISSFLIEGEWFVGINRIYSNQKDMELHPNLLMEDKEGNLWFGTDEGYLLKGWRHSNRLELIRIGLPFKNVTISFLDSDGDWWFSDSQFKRTGELLNSKNNNDPFIASWKESDNYWTFYDGKKSHVIQNMDVNSINRNGSIMYFGTMSGLLYLDLYDNVWNIISTSNGLNDFAIWDMIEYDNSMYVATTNGINEISLINHSVIPDRQKQFDFLLRVPVYDLIADSNYFYLATDLGLFEMNWEIGKPQLITEKIFKKIKLYDGEMFGLDDHLWSIDIHGNKEKKMVSNIHDFDICNSHIWVSERNKARIIQLNTNFEMDYDYLDGIPGNKIFGIECDEEWVWFLTNDGVAFYKWGNYHQEN
ncbi:MAG: two-component regulator propeller domain-containing protein [Candidatus Neomarinimicrobiota bacterium]|nr:two-component regulator propeller domain-containing protein [Candidatus Neomarinimicrobiota bacterium]